jgi:putative protease
MSDTHLQDETIGIVTHYYSHLGVAAVKLTAPLKVGDRIHVRGHTTDLVQPVGSMEVDHRSVEAADPGDDVALKVDEHVREHDQIWIEE